MGCLKQQQWQGSKCCLAVGQPHAHACGAVIGEGEAILPLGHTALAEPFVFPTPSDTLHRATQNSTRHRPRPQTARNGGRLSCAGPFKISALSRIAVSLAVPSRRDDARARKGVAVEGLQQWSPSTASLPLSAASIRFSLMLLAALLSPAGLALLRCLDAGFWQDSTLLLSPSWSRVAPPNPISWSSTLQN